jgi:chromosome segregation ATPase
MNRFFTKRELDTQRSRVTELETLQERLREELRSMQDNQAVLQRIDYLAKDVARNEEKLQKIFTKRTTELLQLFDKVPDAKSLRLEFRQGQERVERRLKAAETEQNRLESEIGARKSARNELKRDLNRKTDRAGTLEDRVRDVLSEGAGDLASELAGVREQLELARRELQVKEAGRFTYREMLERMGRMARPACPTCSREFLAKTEAEELRRDLEAMIEDIPRKTKSLEDKVSLFLSM